jgi:hypothetical protein
VAGRRSITCVPAWTVRVTAADGRGWTAAVTVVARETADVTLD